MVMNTALGNLLQTFRIALTSFLLTAVRLVPTQLLHLYPYLPPVDKTRGRDRRGNFSLTFYLVCLCSDRYLSVCFHWFLNQLAYSSLCNCLITLGSLLESHILEPSQMPILCPRQFVEIATSSTPMDTYLYSTLLAKPSKPFKPSNSTLCSCAALEHNTPWMILITPHCDFTPYSHYCRFFYWVS